MAGLANLNGISDTLITKPKLFQIQRTPRPTIVGFGGKKTEEFHEHPLQLQTSRRVAISLASIALSVQYGIGISHAEDNGFWITGPLPIPPVSSKIANEKTGTRSFIKKGIYIANVGPKGSAYRLKKYAFDLTAMGDLIAQDAWNYVKKYLRLKSTFMYYDFDTVISAAPISDKQPLTDLANRLFDSFEKLEDAVKMKSLSQTEACYQDTITILQEVMNQMA